MIRIFLKNLFTDLYRQPLRTVLTLSGVVWGTFAIVLLLAFGDSVSRQSIKNIHGMGRGIVMVWPGRTTMPYKGFTKGRTISVTPEELEVVRRKVPGIARISPELRTSKRIRYGRNEYNNTIRGVNEEYEFMRNTIARTGRFLNRLDIRHRKRVCLLGNKLAKNLFAEEKPVGKKVLVEGIPFTVVGVMIDKVQSSNYGGMRDENCLFMPFTTFSAIYGRKYVNNIVLEPSDPGNAAAVIANLRQFLGERLGFNPRDEDALGIWDFTELESSVNVFFVAFRIFLGMIGSFTLLVGGVGVASIMLVVVEERTREIGIKLAVGAKRRQILFQFFSESLMIILIGGLIGFGFAALAIDLLPAASIQDFVGIPKMNYTVGVVTIAILLVIGTVSGLMPARKAASTDPIEALRS